MLLKLWLYFGAVLSSGIPYVDSLGYNVYLSLLICMHMGTVPCTKDSLCPWKAIISDNVNTGTKSHCSALVICYLLNDNNILNLRQNI